MPVEVTLKNGDVLTLRDGLSSDEIDQAVNDYLGAPKAPAVVAAPAPSVMEPPPPADPTLRGDIKGFTSGFKQGAVGLADLATKAVLGVPMGSAVLAEKIFKAVGIDMGPQKDRYSQLVDSYNEAVAGQMQEIHRSVNEPTHALGPIPDWVPVVGGTRLDKVPDWVPGLGGTRVDAESVGTLAPVVAVGALGGISPGLRMLMPSAAGVTRTGKAAAFVANTLGVTVASELPTILAAPTWDDAVKRTEHAGGIAVGNMMMAGLIEGTAWSTKHATDWMRKSRAGGESLLPEVNAAVAAQVAAELGGHSVYVQPIGPTERPGVTLDAMMMSLKEEAAVRARQAAKAARGLEDVKRLETTEGQYEARQRMGVAVEGLTQELKGKASLTLDEQRELATLRSTKDTEAFRRTLGVESKYIMGEAIAARVDAAAEKMGPAAESLVARGTDLAKLADPFAFANQKAVATAREGEGWVQAMANSAKLVGDAFDEAMPNLVDRELVTIGRDSPGLVPANRALSAPHRAAIGMVDKAFTGIWEGAVKAGVINKDSFLVDYMNRFYEGRGEEILKAVHSRRPLTAKSSHSLGRVHETLQEAIAMHYREPKKYPLPATIDSKVLTQVYVEEMAKSIGRNTMFRLTKNMAPDSFRWGDANRNPGRDWHQVDDRVISYLASDDTPKANRLYVHEDVYRALAPMIERDPIRGTPLGRGLMDFVKGVKRVKLLIDAFHVMQLARASWASGWHADTFLEQAGLYGRAAAKELNPLSAAQQGLSMISEQHPLYKTAVKSGLELGGGADWMRGVQERIFTNDTLSGNAKLIWEGTVGKGLATWDHFLWDRLHKGLKMMAFAEETKKMLGSKHQANLSAEDLSSVVARQVNNRFGGQGRMAAGRLPMVDSLLHLAIRAPDWTETRLRLMTSAFKTGPEGQMARGFATAYALQAAAMWAAANTLIKQAYPGSGWDNKASRDSLGIALPFTNAAGKPLIAKPWGMFGEQLHFLDMAFMKKLNFAKDKMNDVPSTFLRMLENVDYKGAPIYPALRSKESAKAVAEGLGMPIIFSTIDDTLASASIGKKEFMASSVSWLARSVGFQTNTAYPAEIAKELDWVERSGKMATMAAMRNDPPNAMALAKEHNDRVARLLERLKDEYRGPEIMSRIMKNQDKYFIGGKRR